METTPNPFTDEDLRQRKKRRKKANARTIATEVVKQDQKAGKPLTSALATQQANRTQALTNRPALTAQRQQIAQLSQRREGLSQAPIGSTLKRTPGDGGPSASQLKKMGIGVDYSPKGGSIATSRALSSRNPIGGRRVGQSIGDGGIPLTPEEMPRVELAQAKLRTTDGTGQTFRDKLAAASPEERQSMIEDRAGRLDASRQANAERRAQNLAMYDRRQARKPLTRQQEIEQVRQTLKEQALAGRQGGQTQDELSPYERQKQQLDLETRQAKLDQMRQPRETGQRSQGDYWQKAADEGARNYLDAIRTYAAGGGDPLNPMTTDTLGQLRESVMPVIRALPEEQQLGYMQDMAMGVQMAMQQRPDKAQQLQPVFEGLMGQINGLQPQQAQAATPPPVSTAMTGGVSPYPGAPLQSAGVPQAQPIQAPAPQMASAVMPLPSNLDPAQLRVGQRYQAPDGRIAVWNGTSMDVE